MSDYYSAPGSAPSPYSPEVASNPYAGSPAAPPATGYPAGSPYAPPGYANPMYQPLPPMNAMAITSMILGIVGWLVIPFLGSIAAVICGHIGQSQIKRRSERGTGFAITGLILGYTGVIIWGLVGAFFIATFVLVAATVGTTS